VTVEAAEPAAIAGAIGVGTWNTSAEFKDIRVEKNGQTLYAADLLKGTLDWKPDGGRWTVEEGAYRQNEHAVGLSYIGNQSWSDYTLTLKARKLAGAEGFLVVFGRKGEGKYWWNIGGWNNSQHAIEFNQSPVGRPVRGRVETDRWYDIRVALTGNRIRCYLDGQLIHDTTAPETEHFYAVAGRDEASGDIVVKAINTAREPVTATLNLRSTGQVKTGTVTVLTSSGLSDNNSLDEPMRVAPVESPLNEAAREFAHEFPAHSFTVLRLTSR